MVGLSSMYDPIVFVVDVPNKLCMHVMLDFIQNCSVNPLSRNTRRTFFIQFSFRFHKFFMCHGVVSNNLFQLSIHYLSVYYICLNDINIRSLKNRLNKSMSIL